MATYSRRASSASSSPFFGISPRLGISTRPNSKPLLECMLSILTASSLTYNVPRPLADWPRRRRRRCRPRSRPAQYVGPGRCCDRSPPCHPARGPGLARHGCAQRCSCVPANQTHNEHVRAPSVKIAHHNLIAQAALGQHLRQATGYPFGWMKRPPANARD